MKNFVFTLSLIFVVNLAYSQTKNGTVYSEHEAIEKTRSLWSAFKNGDTEKYLSYFADSIYLSTNGEYSRVIKDRMSSWIRWWSGIENLKIEDDAPAYPDAIEYKEGGTWVQDWLKFTGIHEESGIIVNMKFHNIYSFNEDGKIGSFHLYFDRTIFDEINNSLSTRENGKVYINHPYIIQVRKVINAVYYDKDVEKWADFYSPDARFGASPMKWGETIDLETKKEQLKEMLASGKEFKITQVGYPDCIYYAKNNDYVVYSWWRVTEIEGDKKTEIPIMVSHSFNDEGKIVQAYTYYSTNH